jgi:RNA polymerase sigma factor (sigma-70 family)
VAKLLTPGDSPDRAARAALSSFPAFYAYWRPRLLRYLRSQTSDDRWVDDIAQETLLAARARWDEILTFDKPGSWLFKVATTMLRRWQSKAREQCTSLDDMITRGSFTMPARDEHVERRLDLMAAIRMLPRRQREAITLHSLECLPLAEVAEILGISESSAKTHVCRARRRLQEMLTAASPGVAAARAMKGPS